MSTIDVTVVPEAPHPKPEGGVPDEVYRLSFDAWLDQVLKIRTEVSGSLGAAR